MILIFFLPAFLYKNLNNKEGLKKDFIFGTTVAIILLICIFINKYVLYNSTKWKNYLEYNKYRAEYFDYYRYSLDSSKSDEIYKKANITNKELALLDNFFSGFDENLKEKTIKLSKTCKEFNISRNQNILSSLKLLLLNRSGIIYILSAIALIIAILKTKKEILLYVLPFTFLQFLILTILTINGRIVERVYIPLFFAFISTNIIIITQNTDIDKLIIKLINKNYFTKIILSILAIFIFYTLISKTYITPEEKDFINYNLIVLNYIKEHPDNFYLYNHFELEPLTIKNKYNISNYIYIGGWGVFSPLYYQKLQIHNANTINDLITQDNVYIILPNTFDINIFNSVLDNYTPEKIDIISENYVVYRFKSV